MTFTIETKETTKKTGPTDEIFPVGEDGRIIREGRVAVWSSKNGKAKSFLRRFPEMTHLCSPEMTQAF